MEPAELFSLDLTEDEVRLLRMSTWEWGGPAHATAPLTVAMGFSGPDDFTQSLKRLRAALEAGEPLSALDWGRLMLLTEIVFASDFVGSGVDWSTTVGTSDEETIQILRGLQRKIRRSGALNDAINAWLRAQA